MKINHRVPQQRHEDKDENKVLIASNIFRAYDIRGIYPDEINEKVAYKIGQAFVNFLKKSKLNIVVGRDGRLSSPSLKESLIQGIIDSGANVIDVGLSTTPMLYFAVAHYKFDGGIEITASHLSSEYNGFKLVKEKAVPISEKTGLREIKKFPKEEKFPKKIPKGRIIKKKILLDYLKFNLKEFKTPAFKSFKMVIDSANAVPGILIPYLKKHLPFQIYSLFDKLDGNFPNHSPNPLVKENLKWLQKKVKQKKADLGVAFDGDGDRIIFVDERGEIISTDLILALISELILKKNPNQKILFDLCSSKTVSETIKKNRGIPIMSRVGHSFIKGKMRKENIIFAGESSGHYYYRNHYFCESPFFVLLKILKQLSETKKTISELIKPFKKYFHSGEINFKVKNKKKTTILPPHPPTSWAPKILELLERKYKNGKISHLDGLRVDFKDWWFNVRPSQTEPVLRLVVEAKNQKLMERKKRELIQLIKG